MGNVFRSLLIGVIVLGLGVGAAFGAGTAYGRGSTPKATAASATTGQARSATGATDLTGGFSGAGGRPAALGTIDSVTGDTIVVKTQNGSTTVKTDANTAIRKTVAGTADDLKPGTNVVVTGNAGTDGSVTATSIAINQDVTQRQGGQNGQNGQTGQGGERGQGATGGQGGQRGQGAAGGQSGAGQ